MGTAGAQRWDCSKLGITGVSLHVLGFQLEVQPGGGKA